MSRFEVCDPTMLIAFSTQTHRGFFSPPYLILRLPSSLPLPRSLPTFWCLPGPFYVSPLVPFRAPFPANSYSCLSHPHSQTHPRAHTHNFSHAPTHLLHVPHKTHTHTLSNLWFLSSLSKVHLHLLRGAPAMVRLHLLWLAPVKPCYY